MTKNSLILIGALIMFSSLAKAEDATIATQTAKLKPSKAFGAKPIATLSGGTKVKKLNEENGWAQVEVIDANGKVQTGFLKAGEITTGTSVLGNIGKGKRIAMGASKEALGAAGKGKSEASANAMDGMLDAANDESAAADDILGSDEAGLDSAPPSAAPKATSNKSLDRLDTINIEEAEIMAFMKSGGLKSRILK
jgi:hypothetical protein